MRRLIDRLAAGERLTEAEYAALVAGFTPELAQYAAALADDARKKIYGNRIFVRGLIEVGNRCKNDCYYCGIRRSNAAVPRYCLTPEEILGCCAEGHALGFRTFVLQGGEGCLSLDTVCGLVHRIKQDYPDCAVTLSLGEFPTVAYRAMREAGADRYLLRHETADPAHYRRLHPASMSFENRMRCLRDLKEIGYQTGCGFMVGSPYQTTETLYEDLMFIKELGPAMVGIGPFIPQKDTPFGGETAGTLEMTLRLLSILRLMNPHVLLPATTALGTIHPQGREMGILSGANVVMPNLSPVSVREKYKLYDNKICTGDEAAECRFCMQRRMENIGYEVVTDRGDYRPAV